MILVPELYARPRAELLAAAAELGLALRPYLEHDELVADLVHGHLAAGAEVWTEGVLSARPEGFGFVRLTAADFAETAADAYVGPRQLRALRDIEQPSRPSDIGVRCGRDRSPGAIVERFDAKLYEPHRTGAFDVAPAAIDPLSITR